VIDRARMIEVREDMGRINLDGDGILEHRMLNEFRNHAIYLPSSYDWVMGKDSTGSLCLVPLKKKEGKI